MRVNPPAVITTASAARMRKLRGAGSTVGNDLKTWRPAGKFLFKK